MDPRPETQEGDTDDIPARGWQGQEQGRYLGKCKVDTVCNTVRGEGGGLQVPARRLPRGLQPRPHLQPGQRARAREVGGALQHGRGPGHQAGGWVAASASKSSIRIASEGS